ncbi:MAG: hypothetical protein O9341_18430, partial [Paucibacter sp.]|nr:hypothetical protein [Roseateles sp.]
MTKKNPGGPQAQRRRWSHALAALAGLTLLGSSGGSWAQNGNASSWPAHPIKWIVAYPAGGGS